MILLLLNKSHNVWDQIMIVFDEMFFANATKTIKVLLPVLLLKILSVDS